MKQTEKKEETEKKKKEVKNVKKLDFQFHKTNKFIKRVVAHNQTLLFSLLVYVFFSAAIILIFMFIFRVFKCNCNFWQSCSVYFGTGKTIDIEKHRVIVMVEVACRDLFSIYVVGISISNILVPQNPLELSEFSVINNGKIEIRYWVMLPIHQFLHDASIRVFVTQRDRKGNDVGRLVDENEAECNEYIENLQLIRGVRRVIVPKDKSENFIEKLKEKDGNWMLWVIITGKLSNGKQYYVYKTYDIDTIHNGYTYVPIETKKLPESVFCKVKIIDKEVPSTVYMHYNLAYCDKDKDNVIKLIYSDNERQQYRYFIKCEGKYKLEIWNAEFGGLKGHINYILNYFAMFYLNNPGRLSAMLRKII